MKRALRAAVLLLLAFMLLLAGCKKKDDTAGGESSGAGTELPYSESASAAAETQRTAAFLLPIGSVSHMARCIFAPIQPTSRHTAFARSGSRSARRPGMPHR